MIADRSPDPRSVIALSGRNDERPPHGLFPFLLLTLSAAYYLIFFIVSAALQHETLWTPPAPHEVWGYVGGPLAPEVFALVLGGLGALVAGYSLGVATAHTGRHKAERLSGALQTRWTARVAPSPRLRFAACVFALIAVALLNLLQLRVPVLYQILNGAVFFCIAVVRHGHLMGSETRASHIVGYGALLCLTLAYASMQLWTNLFLMITFLAALEILYRRAWWLIWGVMLALAVLVYPMKRTILPPPVAAICIPAGESPRERYVLEVARKCASTADLQRFFAAVAPWARDQLLRRISTVRLLDRVWHETPEPVPYFKGETLYPLLYAAIPRFIWPNKPREDIGNRIGHTYRILSPDDHVTSINLPWIVEFYINFGSTGVIAGLGLAGYVLGGLAWLGTVVTRSTVASLLTVSTLFPLAYQESNLSLMIGNALHGLIGACSLIVLIGLVSRFARRSPSPRPTG